MTRKSRVLIDTNKYLKGKSLLHYCKILSHLLEEHRHIGFLDDLRSCLRARDFKGLISAADSLSSQKYDDASQHFVANQFALLVKKYPFAESLTGLDARGTATETFLSAERRVKRVNRKFDIINCYRFRDSWENYAVRARSAIRVILGERVSYDRCLHQSDFGPGASVGVHGNATNIMRKFSSEKWSVTPAALPIALKALRMNHQLSSVLYRTDVETGLKCYDDVEGFSSYIGRVSICEYNKISFVPKTAKTERTIAVEPLLNGFVQKGIDQEMRKRLKRHGIDLANQQVNQEMARLGSTDDSEDGFVTIDLKSASDSISRELVRYLLPDDWFRLLDRTRSKYYSLNGVVTPYEKFCSMGNGFCFPLETLLFVAAVHACSDAEPGRDFHVYGDDIIVRKSVSRELVPLLRHWGFKTNVEKTFLEGPFRESCGADWFGGQDVRPFTLDYELDSVQNIFKFLNLSRRSERCEAFFASVRVKVFALLPRELLFFRPLPGTDDGAITTTGDEHLNSSHCTFIPQKGGNGRWVWKEIISEPIMDLFIMSELKNQPWLIGVALRGAVGMAFGPCRGTPVVTLRNQVQTKIARKSYSSTSNWLPTQYRT